MVDLSGSGYNVGKFAGKSPTHSSQWDAIKPHNGIRFDPNRDVFVVDLGFLGEEDGAVGNRTFTHSLREPRGMGPTLGLVFGFWCDMGVSKNGGTPKWMVLWWKTPIKMDDLGGTPIFAKHPYYTFGLPPPPVSIPPRMLETIVTNWKVGRLGLLSKNGIIILVATNCMLGGGV